MKVPFRIIGDVHADFRQYRDLCEGAEYSFQVGDLCAFGGFKGIDGIDPERHKIIAGNHDICDESSPYCFRKDPHFLGDFGTWTVPGIGDVFYIRGAFSIDGVRPNEELDEQQLEAAFEHYKATKPSIVISHQCPSFLSGIVGSKSTLAMYGFYSEPICVTGTMMRRMFEEHEPALWAFGHYHKRWHGYVGATKFVCLDILRRPESANCYIDLDSGEIVGLQPEDSAVE